MTPGSAKPGATESLQASRDEICVVAVDECFRGDGERLCNPIGTIPMIGGRLARESFEPELVMTDGFAMFAANAVPVGHEPKTGEVTLLSNDVIDPLFLATVRATEEAIINALVAGETMKGRDDHVALGLPHARLREILRKYGRLVEKP